MVANETFGFGKHESIKLSALGQVGYLSDYYITANIKGIEIEL